MTRRSALLRLRHHLLARIKGLSKKRAGDLANFIRGNLGEVRLTGSDYGPHQMTGIHDLKAFWGKGAQVDVRV